MANQVTAALNKVATGAVLFGAASFFVDQALYNVDGGERAVIWNRFGGVSDVVQGEGTHLRLPFLQYPTIFDVRTKPKVISSVTGTKDLQSVNISLRLLYRPDEKHLPALFKNLGTDYDERVLPSIGNEVLKSIVAQYNADQLLTQRHIISKQVREALVERANMFHVLLDDVSITHLTFGREFAMAIEQKQVAQQQAEMSKFLVMKAEQEKQAAIIRSEGEAEAADLISKALNQGQGLIEIRRIDAAKEIADTLSRGKNVTYLPSGNNMLLNVRTD
eukprot:GILJ01000631.1.p1 GENE.GILJ01000631.1~~GILJ01000631.1.p1  ORF type:complete len:276 (+),score=54.39 GILJ01000631.1:63-890(+)